MAPVQSSSLPVTVGEAFGDDQVFEDESETTPTAKKHGYVNVIRKTEVSRMSSAPLTCDPEYAEPIALTRRGRVYSEQQGARPPSSKNHRRPPPLKRTEGFQIPTKPAASASAVLRNDSVEKLHTDSISLEKIEEADEDEVLPDGSKQPPSQKGKKGGPQLYLEPVQTKKREK